MHATWENGNFVSCTAVLHYKVLQEASLGAIASASNPMQLHPARETQILNPKTGRWAPRLQGQLRPDLKLREAILQRPETGKGGADLKGPAGVRMRLCQGVKEAWKKIFGRCTHDSRYLTCCLLSLQ